MSKRAEERALEAYPYSPTEVNLFGHKTIVADGNSCDRAKYRAGYEAAEKDLAPLIEAATIVYEAWNGGTMDDVRREMVELGKRIIEAKQ